MGERRLSRRKTQRPQTWGLLSSCDEAAAPVGAHGRGGQRRTQTDLFRGDRALDRALGLGPEQRWGLAVVEWRDERGAQRQGGVYGGCSFRKRGRRGTGGGRGAGGLGPGNCLSLKVGGAGTWRQDAGRVGETGQVLGVCGGTEQKPPLRGRGRPRSAHGVRRAEWGHADSRSPMSGAEQGLPRKDPGAVCGRVWSS